MLAQEPEPELELEPGLVPELAPVKARVPERDPASALASGSEQEPGLVLAQELVWGLEPG